ncbi:MAG: AmmeMemoRadiSam system protein A [Planctomycetes bacterium]|nr:AmmeMemoRadiSam system protein A [Planctomycetota bacterium]
MKTSFPELHDPPVLTRAEQCALGRIALRALLEVCGVPPCEESGRPPVPEVAGTEGFSLSTGVFVTLFAPGEDLRGCVGSAQGGESLGIAVDRLARAAATRDHRFPPLREDELPGLRLEITLLGPLARLPSDPEGLLTRLVPARHGLQIRFGGQTGLLLPQVARRLGWGPARLLEQVCIKAGLPRDAWRLGEAALHAFTAGSFGFRVGRDLALEEAAGEAG